MTAVLTEKDVYLTHFERFEKERHAQPALRRLRESAMTRFTELGFPTLRDEEWRFTNLATLKAVSFELGESEESPIGNVGKLPKGVIVCSLAEALAKHPELVEPHLARYADYEDHAFVALNTAFLHNGAFVCVSRGTVVENPIDLSFRAPLQASPAVWHRRVLIVMEENSQARIVETYESDEGSSHFTNAVTEIVLAQNAILDHYKVQKESKQAFHIATQQVLQQRSSTFTSHAITLGGGLVRNDVNVVLDGEGCEATVNGLYLAGGRQHVDNHTRIDHAKPRCASHELYKGILDGKAHGVFNGKIYVHQDAQKTDAKQTNKTLLLSDDAVIDTKPQLEIFADDVKCTHGATVGQLAEEAIFYLRSRGIGREEARSLLTFAFANDIIGRIKVEPLRAELEQRLFATQHRLEDVVLEAP